MCVCVFMYEGDVGCGYEGVCMSVSTLGVVSGVGSTLSWSDTTGTLGVSLGVGGVSAACWGRVRVSV